MEKIDLKDGGYLYYSGGRFDSWCVYEIDKDGIRSIPKDIDYFREYKELSSFFDSKELYNDFVEVYDRVEHGIKDEDIAFIDSISVKYDEYSDRLFRLLSILYMGMIAEQNKAFTKLGKRIKRLGMYYLLIKDLNPEYCANFMKNMGWREIDVLCSEGGF